MDKAYLEKQLSALFSKHLRRSNPRRVKVYAQPLDKNFELINPSGRPPSPTLKLELAKDGIRMGWKTGATVSQHQVFLLELSLMVHAHLGRTKA